MKRKKYRPHHQSSYSSWHHGWELLIAMTEREIKARYKHAVLGFLWVILNPLLQMIVIGSVFSFVFRIAVADYFLFLFTGLLMWNFFSLTFLKVTPAIVFELNLIEKAKFPREVIVLSIILSNLFHTLISFILFAFVLLVIGKLNVMGFLFLPFVLGWVTLLLIGIGLFSAAVNVRFRDVNFFVQAIVPLWFYATPVIYQEQIIPEQLRTFLYFNPMVGIIELTRWTMLGGTFPNIFLLFSNVLMTFCVCVIGVVVFKNQMPFFDDWV